VTGWEIILTGYFLVLKYTPFARLKLDARFQLSRKGAETTIEQQYVASPQPVFLFKKSI